MMIMKSIATCIDFIERNASHVKINEKSVYKTSIPSYDMLITLILDLIPKSMRMKVLHFTNDKWLHNYLSAQSIGCYPNIC